MPQQFILLKTRKEKKIVVFASCRNLQNVEMFQCYYASYYLLRHFKNNYTLV